MERIRQASLILLIGISLVVHSSTAAQAETGYFADLPEIPLMEGFWELPDAGLSFDKPAGRIVEVEAEGKANTEELQRFYGLLLPELGWILMDEWHYVREDETLTIEVIEPVPDSSESGLSRIRFYLRPR